jgi:iron complex transport system substrate-binding protein
MMPTVRRLLPSFALITLLLASACGGDDDRTTSAGPSERFPMTIENCGRQTTIDAPPERVLVIGDDGLPLLPVNALDSVVAIAGDPPLDLYDQERRQRVAKIPTIGSQLPTGAPMVSLEAVIAQSPDLVIGIGMAARSGVTPDALAGLGIPVIELPSFCVDQGATIDDPGFDDVYAQVELYGRVFSAEDEAKREVAELRERVEAIRDSARGLSGRTAAALLLTPRGPAVFAFGDGSMFDAQMDALGLTNVFGDVSERAFEVSIERLLATNPEVVVVGYSSGQPEQIKQAFLDIPGIGGVKAVRNDAIVLVPFAYVDPPTPLSVEGLKMIAEG